MHGLVSVSLGVKYFNSRMSIGLGLAFSLGLVFAGPKIQVKYPDPYASQQLLRRGVSMCWSGRSLACCLQKLKQLNAFFMSRQAIFYIC